MTWIDLTDVIEFLGAEPSVTGIQRVALDLTSAMCALSGGCRPCAYCEEDAVFKTAPLEELLAYAAQGEKMQSAAERLRRRVAKTAVSLVPRKLRRKLGLGKAPTARIKIAVGSRAHFRRGDVFVCLGAFWQSPNHVHRMQKAVFVNEMKFALMVHDLIPVNHSVWFSQESANGWSARLKDLLRLADCIFANSQFTANEIRRFAVDNKVAIGPITVVRLGDPTFVWASRAAHLSHPPSLPGPLPALARLRGRAGRGPGGYGSAPQYRGANFVLMVSSIDVRKNQKFLLPIWSRLICELGREATPDLLLIGKNANGGREFLALVDESPELKGKVVVLNQVRDNELAWYYRRALFTVFPSLAEGWGFPVAESLSFGKVCVASDVDALPEVGKDLVSYFAANDLHGAYDLIKGLIVNPTERMRLEQAIADRYQPTEWAAAANAILAALSRTERPREP
jgi:glycosyltransferase involved in cell wall biosynthesis